MCIRGHHSAASKFALTTSFRVISQEVSVLTLPHLQRIYPQLLHLRYKLADLAESRTDAQSTDSSVTDTVSGRGAEEATDDQKEKNKRKEETCMDGEQATQLTNP